MLKVSPVTWNDGTRGQAFLADSTHHYANTGNVCPGRWPDVCDGHEPAWSTWCGKRSWDSRYPPLWTATGNPPKAGGGWGPVRPLRMQPAGGQPYAQLIEYHKGWRVTLRTCPAEKPVVTGDGKRLPVIGTGCGGGTTVLQ